MEKRNTIYVLQEGLGNERGYAEDDTGEGTRMRKRGYAKHSDRTVIAYLYNVKLQFCYVGLHDGYHY